MEIGKNLEKAVVEKLIEVYGLFISKGITKEVEAKAKQLHDGLLTAGPLLSKSIESAISKLFSMAYSNVQSEAKPLSKEEAKKIIKELRERGKKLQE